MQTLRIAALVLYVRFACGFAFLWSNSFTRHWSCLAPFSEPELLFVMSLTRVF